ncbi:predicted protein [Histoplasma capsulatum var. duboisii H88]|uniref:Predicted protein n=1 Tax=Ajellomyces capsulatus (strain H88) TaxID=544711 RepID=F0US17_AJEC8|nr:predicted protein [Histoplasma capsulatum var. duboisii H88]
MEIRWCCRFEQLSDQDANLSYTADCYNDNRCRRNLQTFVGGPTQALPHHVQPLLQPLDTRDPCHWAFWLEAANGLSTILQVGDDKGGEGYFVEQPIYKEPQRSIRLKETIVCGTTPTEKTDEAVSKIQSHPVDNQSTTWNCQLWIMENLDDLEIEGYMQVSPTAKANLQSKRQNWQ